MFKKGKLNRRTQGIVKARAISLVVGDTLCEDESKNEGKERIDCYTVSELLRDYPKILRLKATLDDVVQMADDYGCTVDYLLGRTDSPYYTL